jgi:hypothetical protein
MIFRIRKCQNRNFSQIEAQIFDGLLRYQKLLVSIIFGYVVSV